MTVVPKAEPAPGAGETAATQVGTPAETGRDAGDGGKPNETDAERAARLETELRNTRAQQAAMQASVEEAKRIAEQAKALIEQAQGAGAQPLPTATAPPDPLAQHIANLQAQLQANPNDAATSFALDQAFAMAEQRRQYLARQTQEREFAAMPDGVRARAYELWTQGYAANPALARQAAEREAKSKDETEKLRKENEELKRDREARDAPKVALGGGSPISATPAATPEGRIRMTQAQWAGLDSLPLPRQRELLRAYNDGRIDWAD